jgi:hypothetical protein
MAFRAWNRGLAATSLVAPGVFRDTPNTYGVWIFDGARWAPDFTFLGNKECPGNTIVWAGKRDYWLVGPGPKDEWPAICRYDGWEKLAWQKLPLPAATLGHVTPAPTSAHPNPARRPGGITSAACFAWNNCWFFGTYGVVVHWNGKGLEDATPPSSEGWLQGEYTGAVARENLAGEPFGVAVGADRERSPSTEKLPPQPGGAEAPEMYGSRGGGFSPLVFAPPLGDPFGTDLVAGDFDPAEQGWVAGNPAGLRLGEGAQEVPTPYTSPAASPLEPVSASGASSGCKAPAPNFEYRTPGAPDPAGSFLWSSISVVPGSGEALAGGSMRQQDPRFGEPVIAQVSCDGAATLTRFRVPEAQSGSQPAPLVTADREGAVTAIAANAANDAWAATSMGFFVPPGKEQAEPQPPRLYRLTNGKAPEAPEGNNDESRPRELVEEEKHYEEEKAPAETAAAPPLLTVTPIPPITLPPAIYDVKVKLHRVKRHGRTYLSLYLTFKVMRPIKLGAQALRRGHVVSTARAHLFSGHTGQLILNVERKRWPTNIRFIS